MPLTITPFEVKLNLFPSQPYFGGPGGWGALLGRITALRQSEGITFNPTILPFGNDAPLDAPRMILESTDQGKKLTFTPNKITLAADIFPEGGLAFAESYFSDLLDLLKQDQTAFKRIGLIKQFFARDEEQGDAFDVDAYMIRRFFKAARMSGAQNVVFNFTKKSTWSDQQLDINHYFKLMPGQWQHIDQPEYHGLLVDLDVNNKPFEDESQTVSDPQGLVRWAFTQVSEEIVDNLLNRSDAR